MADKATIERWLKVLGKRLDKRSAAMTLWENYYNGVQRLTYATDKFRKTFGNVFAPFADNFCSVVVDAEEERLNIDGFRFPSTDRSPARADEAAHRIWQRNSLDAYSQIAHQEALSKGECSLLVWPDRNGLARITIEDGRQMAVALDPEDPRNRLAAMKRYRQDDDGYAYATLYLPDGIYKFKSRQKVHVATGERIQWVLREVANEEWPVRNPWGIVPVIPLINRRALNGEGRSELADVVPRQDAINKLTTDMLVASEFVAFPQRWATGLSIPKKDDGTPIEDVASAVNRLWGTKSRNAKFGQFPQGDLTPYVKASESILFRLASATRTPPHYFMAGMGQFPSGESLKSSETGLVAKVRRAGRHFGETWETSQRLAFLIEGDTERAMADGLETLWLNPESRTESELADAAIKKREVGIPQEKLWEDLGYSTTEIARMKQMQAEEARRLADAYDPFANTPGGSTPDPDDESVPVGV